MKRQIQNEFEYARSALLFDKIFAGFDQKVWRRENGFVEDIWTDLGFSEAWDETQRQH